MWMYISILLFWLLCGSWAIRMEEKAENRLADRTTGYLFVVMGCFILVLIFCGIWPARLWRFIKGIRQAWEQALKG